MEFIATHLWLWIILALITNVYGSIIVSFLVGIVTSMIPFKSREDVAVVTGFITFVVLCLLRIPSIALLIISIIINIIKFAKGV